MLLLLLGLAGPSSAATSGSIDHVEPEDGKIGVLYSIPGLTGGVEPDLGSLTVTVDGVEVDASAEIAADAGPESTVRRTAILAIDVSNSMRGEPFVEAKLAAKAFLGAVTDDVYVGIVAFAGDVTTAQDSTLDRDASVEILDGLTLSSQTRLYDGVLEAVRAAGSEGQRSVLVLSDGKDTSRTALTDVSKAIDKADVRLNVVALGQAPDAVAALDRMASAGGGSVLSADDPKALTEVFATEAEALAKQVLVTAELPADMTTTEGTVAVSITAGDETYTDTAFVTLTGDRGGDSTVGSPRAAPEPRFAVSQDMMFVGLGVAGLACLMLLLSAFGVFTSKKSDSIQDHIAAYMRSGGSRGTGGSAGSPLQPTARPDGLAGSAVGIAERALASNKGLAASVGARLEAAGMSFKPAEWLLMHTGIAFGAALIGLLLSSGGFLLTILFLLGGLALPWFYLGFKRKKRIRKFNDQLADTLQLISGGLSAGLSLAQSVDTVVRQGSEPMTTEFKRALMEARLGVPLEDTFESIAERMESEDFTWVVMAVRIQREVGGNLAEVLTQVAATIRERAYLRRQVKSLSAEGKLSAYILCGLPIAVLAFLVVSRPGYLAPMLHTTIGWLMFGAAAVLMAMGAFWMSKMIKMEV